ncbi:MAG TPA: phosphoribulokinase [Acidobacteriota bacterium]|nr:phosphoribulokinase [Acidobacteriota bacterium]HMZ78949.1 phosphoribulokinase [Acidobacteriota bacterium]HND19250.1 phosphoribulokinase [Acidobacteriota bacterium]HNG95795.1 phosphoribulokinase [Acidobacteriota bacterium]HNJ42443.1 phosphoribulokinase [Acidobacteriota bacterium]
MKRQRPIILGIVGDSAAGKSTLTRGLAQLIGPERVTCVCTDDYHKYDRRERAEHKITALHPDCNYLDVLEQHLERLHYGQPILKPVYDHSTGSLVRPEYVQPSEFVIVEGLLGYHSAVMRQFYDVKVYLSPPEELRRVWKVKRDTSKRGYQPAQVLSELERREPDSQDFIRPQREFADIVVQFYPPEGISPEEAGGDLNVRLILRPTIRHPDLTYLSENKVSSEAGVRMNLGRDSGKPVDILEIDGGVLKHHAVQLQETIWKHLPEQNQLTEDQFGNYIDNDDVRHSAPLAITQLLLAYHLLREYSGERQMIFAPPVSALSRVQTVSPNRRTAR